MKITQDVCEYAKEQNVEAEKAKEFVVTGSEIYYRNLPKGTKDHH